ncbi:UNVERIFIED_CONTAM: hypothetical protein Slati_3980700 [Sesamum latifolium]|uniref:Zinc knuckle CX2CX4HX4C domain-containing protein n=1 Tax=Sesamum latifolium TaxID=2727402 RepID=A0AAW2TQZ7_9LAMI
MEFKQFLGGRILTRFFHIIDRQKTLEGCPWSFEKNILILTRIDPNENPMSVNLNWCGFYVYVHDLPLIRMNLGISTHIGNRLGIFQDMEMDEAGRKWGDSLCIRVAIDVINNLLKRALRIRTKMGDEHLVNFTYERLSNFCYLCKQLGHIGKYCEQRFQEGSLIRERTPSTVLGSTPPRHLGVDPRPAHKTK